MLKEKESCSLEQTGKELLHNEEIEEIFAYYGKQRDKGSQEMVIALLRELQEAEGCIPFRLPKTNNQQRLSLLHPVRHK